jgi:hypothetical protein
VLQQLAGVSEERVGFGGQIALLEVGFRLLGDGELSIVELATIS